MVCDPSSIDVKEEVDGQMSNSNSSSSIVQFYNNQPLSGKRWSTEALYESCRLKVLMSGTGYMSWWFFLVTRKNGRGILNSAGRVPSNSSIISPLLFFQTLDIQRKSVFWFHLIRQANSIIRVLYFFEFWEEKFRFLPFRGYVTSLVCLYDSNYRKKF